jgi:drug/metabolite transporter (DMT)-like permease
MTALGAAIAFAAAVANAFALVLQADEVRKSPLKATARASLLWRLARRPRWLLGTALLALGWPLQVLALAFAPITVVQPMLATFQLILMVIVHVGRGVPLYARQWLAALATVVGVVVIVVAAPHRTVDHPAPGQLAIPLVVVGVAALVAYGAARVRARRAEAAGVPAAAPARRHLDEGVLLALGAGFGYAWADFADKLLSNEITVSHWLPASIWLLAIFVFGALAFLQENSALQYRSPVVVAPVIGALQEPLPVLMAVVGGVELWTGGPGRVAALAVGLALVGGGAVVLARSPDVAALAHGR